MNIHSLRHLIVVLQDSQMTVTKVSACLSKDTTVVKFDEVHDHVEGLDEEEFSAIVE